MANQAVVDLVVDTAGTLPQLERQLTTIVQTAQNNAPHIDISVEANSPDFNPQIRRIVERAEDRAPEVQIDVEIDRDALRRVITQVGRLGPAARSSARDVGILGGALVSVGGAVPAIASVIAALEQIAPAAAVGTQGVLALQLAAGTLKLAMIGVEDAIEAAFDPDAKPEDLEKALKRLAPEARKTVEALRGMRSQLRGIQQEVQNRFFKDFDDSLRQLGRTTLPTVQRALNDTASTLNRVARSSADAASELATNGTLGRALDGATKGLENLADIPAKVVTGLGQIAAAAAPAFDKVTRRIDTFAANTADKLAKAFESGRLEESIDEAISTVGQLFRILENFGSGIGNIFGGLTQDGGGLFDTLEKISQAFEKLTASREFQSILKELSLTASELVDQILPLIQEAFVQLAPVIRELAPVVRDFIREIGPQLIPVIQEVGPLLMDLAKIAKDQLPLAIDLTSAALSLLVKTLQLVQDIMDNVVLPVSRKFSEFYQSEFAQSINDVVNFVGGKLLELGQDFLNWRSSVNGSVNQVLGALGAFVGRLRDSFVRGVVERVAEVTRVFQELPNRIAGFLIGLPARMFGIGFQILNGLIGGIQSGVGRLLGVVQGIADRITSTIASAMKIASPSKVTAAQGRFIAQGLVVGLLGTARQVQAAAQKIADIIAATLAPGRGRSALLGRVDAGERALVALANRETAVARQLDAANKRLADVVKERNELSQSVRQGILSAADVTDIRGVQTAGDILASLTDRLAKARVFAQQLADLRSQGVRADIIAQIAQAGVEQGSAAAAALANASKTEIDQINATQAQLVAAAGKAGAVAGDALFGAGVRAAQGLVKGLQSQQSAIERQMLLIAKSMQDAIKKALKIASPSRVMAALGSFTGEGFAQGVESMLPRIGRAVEALTGVASGSATGSVPGLTLAAPAGPNVNVFIGSERLDARIDFRTNRAFRERDRTLTQGVRRLG